ncbi:BMP family lipoprotein [Rhodospirillum sp. A1_3_36]|uniref:BMP family lipoprotein n=1 Tax=Rhodospirillum sp. A1_3_36 TaxID=3391666 RepID=UPI0039A5D843
MKTLVIAALSAVGLLSGSLLSGSLPQARADEAFKPAIVFDLGGKFDKSFNQAVDEGAQRFAERTGETYRGYEPQNEAQVEQGLRKFADKGFSPIVAVGFNQAKSVEKIAKDFPDVKFVLIDAVVDLPNVKSVLFKEHEGSYLAGAIAAMKSESGTIGFVGGMDIPLIRKFACGYKQGAVAINPNITVIENMTGTTGAAWNDPVKGGELAKSQIDRGADVIFHAAGATGLGVLQAAADAGKLGIGVDSNQNHILPGHVLTSMVKRVGVATDVAFTEAKDGTFTPGLEVLGLAEDGVGLAMDENNAPLITPEITAKLDALKAAIIDGSLTVHDYMSDDTCPL